MNGTDNSKKWLAFLVFVSSSISAFCLGVLAINLTTGQLPFGLTPLTGYSQEKEVDTVRQTQGTAAPVQIVVDAEEYALSLFEELRRAKEEVDQQAIKLVEQKRLVEALAENAEKIQNELKHSEQMIRNLLTEIDEKEIDNVKQLAKLISSLDSIAGVEMLLELDEALASRSVYYMAQEKKSEFLTIMMKSNDEKQKNRAIAIAEALQKLTERLEI